MPSVGRRRAWLIDAIAGGLLHSGVYSVCIKRLPSPVVADSPTSARERLHYRRRRIDERLNWDAATYGQRDVGVSDDDSVADMLARGHRC